MTASLADRLEMMLTRIDCAAVARAAAGQGPGEDAETLKAYLETYLNEALVGLDLIAPTIDGETPRILEIGSGVGILTAFLSSAGYDITGIEPGAAAGFDFMGRLGAALSDQEESAILPIGAEALTPEDHGRFDLIFSVNVVEHVQSLDSAMAALARVLAPGGTMIHLCPNYAFPYEPHLGIPLIPFAPQATRHIARARIRRQQRVWDSVNFVTAGRIARLAAANGMAVRFRGGVMAAFLDRLRTDPVFRARQPGPIAGMVRIPGLVTALAGAMRLIPPRLASPMVFTLKHRTE
ncbi:MAG: class I SAM-dependent methyltransferase [Pseudomonadota bacterium]